MSGAVLAVLHSLLLGAAQASRVWTHHPTQSRWRANGIRREISEVGDMESLPRPIAHFDAATGFNSFPFAGNPVVALAEARRVLVGDGKLGIVVFLSPEKSQQTRIMVAISALAPPAPSGGPGPFALSAPGALESALQAAGLRSIDVGEFPVVMSFPDAETACKAFLAGGGSARAIQHSGEERVRRALRDVLEGFRVDTGGYRIENRFRFVIAA